MLLSEGRRKRRQSNSGPMTSDPSTGAYEGRWGDRQCVGVRGEGFCFTPFLTFAAQPEASYKCEEIFQTPGGSRC